MALIKCKECKKEIAKDAKICPNCGTLTKYGKELKVKKQKTILIAMMVLLVLLILTYVIVNARKEENKIIGKWVREYENKIGDITINYIDIFIFNSDGTCVNETDFSSDPCSYKVKNNKITITWLNDEYWYDDNENLVKSLTMPFIQGEDYIVIDEDKYEKKN